MSDNWGYVALAYGFAYGALLLYGVRLARRYRALPPSDQPPWQR